MQHATYVGRNRHRYTARPENPGFSNWHRTIPGVRGVDVDLICWCDRQCAKPLYVIEAKKGLRRIGSDEIRTSRTFQIAQLFGVPAFLAMFDPTSERAALDVNDQYATPPCGCVDNFDESCDHGIDLQVFEIGENGPDWSFAFSNRMFTGFNTWAAEAHVCSWGVTA